MANRVEVVLSGEEREVLEALGSAAEELAGARVALPDRFGGG